MCPRHDERINTAALFLRGLFVVLEAVRVWRGSRARGFEVVRM